MESGGITQPSALGASGLPSRRGRPRRDLFSFPLDSPVVWGVGGTLASVAIGFGIARGDVFGGAGLAGIGLLSAFLLIYVAGFRGLLIWTVATVVLYPFARFPQEQALLTLNRVWLTLMVVALLFTGRNLARSRPSKLAMVATAVFVAAIGARAAFTEADLASSVARLWLDGLLLPLFAFVVTAFWTTTERRLGELVGALTLAGAVLGILALADRMVGLGLESLSGGTPAIEADVGLRVSGPFSSNDALALALLPCLAATIVWAHIDLRRRFAVAAPIVALELIGIGLTFFRIAWVGAVVLLVVSVGLRPSRPLRFAGVGLAVLLVAASLIASIGGSSAAVAERLDDRGNIYGRLATYEESIRVVEESPLVGVGISRFLEAQQESLGGSVGDERSLDTAHNAYLAVLAEAGLLGFLPMIVLTIAVWRLLRAYRRAVTTRLDTLFAAAAVGVAVAYLIVAMALNTTYSEPGNLFLLVILGAAAGRLDAITNRSG